MQLARPPPDNPGSARSNTRHRSFSKEKANKNLNKKVLLCERKRHTTRRVASSLGWGVPHPALDGAGAPSSPGMGGVPHKVLDVGTPSRIGWRVPPVLILDGATPYHQDGVPPI